VLSKTVTADEHPAASTLYDAAASREVDAYAIAHLGVSGFELMNRAADAAFTTLLQQFPSARSISVWCGKGNNAGDAYLVAARAQRYGISVHVIALVDPAELSGDAAAAYAEARSSGVPITMGIPTQAPSADVAIDGLLGTGLSGPPRAPFDEAIAALNGFGIPVLSIDVPSGVNAATGAVYGEAVHAQVTVSFITRKIGLYTGAGVSVAGRRDFADLGVPAQMYVAAGVPLQWWQPGSLPALDANTYKHRQGHVVVAGGDAAMPGAVVMAAEAALRVGAGMVTAVTQPQHSAAIVARTPEVMVRGYYHDAAGETNVDNNEVVELLQRADLVVLGPGLGRSAWSEALFGEVERSGKPTLLDADGLYWLAARGAWQGGDLTITPHVAEAARLLSVSAADVQNDRASACRELQQRFHCRGVLKGAGSVTFTGPAAELAVCAHGNPGMATAGMGDVLSGVAGGLLAAVADDPAACDARLVSAVALHSAAGDAAAQRVGQISLVATDVIDALPALLKTVGGD
jgi:NAD(P)H-hydrate epimerase